MTISKWSVFVGAAAVCCALAVQAQDSPPLGDVARQSRQQKQQQDAQSSPNPPSDPAQGQQTGDNPSAANPAKSPHVITNDELPEQHTSKSVPTQHSSNSAPSLKEVKHPAEYFRTQALQLKTAIVSLQKRIDIVTHSIYYAGGNYETNVVWNERQRQKQLQVETMKGQLADLQNRLETLQETARRQGYGNSVYDP